MKKVILAAALFSFFSSMLPANAGSSEHKDKIVAHIAQHENYIKRGWGQQALDLLARIVIPIPMPRAHAYYYDSFQIKTRHYSFAADLGFKKRCTEIPGPFDDGETRMDCFLRERD
ncbi:hypothetical protein [Bartonella saheliensis]|uniref:hypothetical protein n=1 Tax=Bartonella saheliensis TaxID=1457016 RepID=UPI0011AA875E|nr:hypothetical protein [Bartonella saheliensis]